MEYNFKETEQKWQKFWKENGTYKVDIDPAKPKFYVLDMFPYPSGAGLHVGHPLGYIASDIYSRYKRLKGFNVLHPMGFDAYGLPAEQYAIQTGQHPAVTTEKNIARYREQLLLSVSYSVYLDHAEFCGRDFCLHLFAELYRQAGNAFRGMKFRSRQPLGFVRAVILYPVASERKDSAFSALERASDTVFIAVRNRLAIHFYAYRNVSRSTFQPLDYVLRPVAFRPDISICVRRRQIVAVVPIVAVDRSYFESSLKQ